MRHVTKPRLFLLALMGALLVVLTGCGSARWGSGSVIWTLCVLFFWVIFIVLLLRVFSDIFWRDDLSGWGKAGWTILIIFIPLLGMLIYVIARPKIPAHDKQPWKQYAPQQPQTAGHSAADEIAKAQALKDSGAITDAEFQEMKRKALL